MKAAILIFLNQKQLADYLGVSRRTLVDHLNGVSPRKYKTTRRSEEGLLMVECSGCKRFKFLPDFSPRRDRPLGVCGRCRECQNKKERDYRKKKKTRDPLTMI